MEEAAFKDTSSFPDWMHKTRDRKQCKEVKEVIGSFGLEIHLDIRQTNEKRVGNTVSCHC